MIEKYDKLLPINEAYIALQGEGQLTGIPHILIRFTGCRLRCQFENSFCDTPYSSWGPEKGIYTYDNIEQLYIDNPHIKYTLITGGGPTLHKEILPNLCNLAKEYDHYITIETEGSEFVQTCADLISLSPKLSNSVPVPGTWMDYLDRKVTLKDKEQHEKWRTNYNEMKLLIDNHKDYQLKPVISYKEDLEEVRKIQKILEISNDKVWLMPEGLINNELKDRRKWLVEICIKEGYNFSDRLHIIAYGDVRGV